MKLINQSAEYLPQGSGIEGTYKQIELAGRTSYLSWDKMTDDSAKKFVDMLIKSKHTSVLEHGTVYLRVLGYSWDAHGDHFRDYVNNPYSSTDCNCGEYYITTNLRVLQENGWLDDLQYLCEPTEFHEKRLSVKVITDIGVTREFNRHRTFSIVEQSTRYCNFSKDKFGNELTFIIPYGFRDIILEGDYKTNIEPNFDWPRWKCAGEFLLNLKYIEELYMRLLENNYSPQQARAILPLCTKTEAIYTAFECDWRDWFDKRLFGKTGAPYPDMLVLANIIKQEFEKAGVWEEIMKYPSKFE